MGKRPRQLQQPVVGLVLAHRDPGALGSVGLSAAMLLCGLAYFAVTMLPAVDPRWREIDRRRDAEPVLATASP